MENIHTVKEMSPETNPRELNLASGNNSSIVPHFVAGINQEPDNEIKHVPFLSDLIKLEKKFEISEEMVSNEDVNIQLSQFENFNNVSGCQEVIQPGLCRVDRHIKEENSVDTSEHFINSQAGVQKIQIESVYSVQHSQLVRADVFTENLPEHIRNIEKNTSDETGDCEMFHEHKGDTVIKSENKNVNLCLTSREQKLNNLRELVSEQVMVENVVCKIVQNEDSLNINNGICSKLSEYELYVFKKSTRHNVCSVSYENLDKCDGLTKHASLNTYRKTYGGEKAVNCHVSNLEFNCSDNKKSHRNVHTGEKPYKCDVCGVRFSRTGNLNKHKKTHTGEKPYKCDVCGLGFSQTGNLKSHKRTHTGEKPYKCDVCDVGFSETGSLKRHKRTHTGEKPYKCDVCGLGFSQAGNLKNHKRVHTGEKPYKCDVCGLGFYKTGDLKYHKRIHTGEKPYTCNVCGVGFSRTSHLKNHKRTHTGEKPYTCDVCGVGFSETGSRKRHKRIHTGEKPY